MTRPIWSGLVISTLVIHGDFGDIFGIGILVCILHIWPLELMECFYRNLSCSEPWIALEMKELGLCHTKSVVG